jgi:hypothetical protein
MVDLFKILACSRFVRSWKHRDIEYGMLDLALALVFLILCNNV